MKRALWSSLSLVSWLVASPVQGAVGDESLPRYRTGYVVLRPDQIRPGSSQTPRSSHFPILYVNGKGGTYEGWQYNDSSNNLSTIVPPGKSTIPPATFDAEEWAELMRCVKIQFGSFGITVTDEDPGSTPHIEAVVGGKPQDIGLGSGVGGVAPFTCGVIDSAIVFIFQQIYGNRVQLVCEVVAQEAAHAIGLDHEFYCPDPMTYLSGCGDKFFRDYPAPCGEDAARSCQCGGETQNSVALLRARLGLPEQIPPQIVLKSPLDGTKPYPRFPIEADVTDNYLVAEVEFFVDGTSVKKFTRPPFKMYTSPDLPLGAHEIRIVARDPGGNVAEAVANVEIVPECTTSEQCGDGEICQKSVCGTDIGGACEFNEECAVGFVCVTEGRESLCTKLCSPGSDSCPSGFVCQTSAQGSGRCWPGGDGGCSAARPGALPRGAGAVVVLLGVVFAGVALRGRAGRRRARF